MSKSPLPPVLMVLLALGVGLVFLSPPLETALGWVTPTQRGAPSEAIATERSTPEQPKWFAQPSGVDAGWMTLPSDSQQCETLTVAPATDYMSTVAAGRCDVDDDCRRAMVCYRGFCCDPYDYCWTECESTCVRWEFIEGRDCNWIVGQFGRSFECYETENPVCVEQSEPVCVQHCASSPCG